MAHSRIKPNQQILDEAAEWFVDLREGDLSAAELQTFSQWLRRSPEHITAYLEVAAFWVDVPNLADKEAIDVQALIAYAQGDDNVVSLGTGGRGSHPENARPAQSAGRSSARSMRAAVSRLTPKIGGLLAASAIVAIVGLASWHVAQRGTYRTDIGEQRSVLLEDGSTVELNAKSRLRVRFTAAERSIELLEGQALFRVSKDPLRPFIVSSGDTKVRAVGTQFDVYRKRSGTTVTVVEGRVAVSSLRESRLLAPLPAQSPSRVPGDSGKSAAGTEAIVLSAGQQIVVSLKTVSLPKPADIPAATAWTQRQIVFQGAPLREVVEEFNRYNPRQMEILDEALQGVRVSGVFSSTEPASLLRFLREQVRLEVIEDPDRVQISRR